MLPGITKRMLKKLKKEDVAVVTVHISAVKSAIQKKKDIFDGKLSEFGEYLKKQQTEIELFARLVKAAGKYASNELLLILLSLEVNSRELMRSVAEENTIIKKFEQQKSSKIEAKIKRDFEGELILASIVEHQIEILYDTQKLCQSAYQLLKEIKKSRLRAKIGKAISSLDNFTHYVSRVIFDEEIPNLAVTYNMLELSEWDKIETEILKIKSQFFDTEAHLL